MPRSNLETKWVKFGKIEEFVFLNDDVIAASSGLHVLFLNLTTGDEKIEVFDNEERGSGASCLAGHPVVPMFATAEKRSHPKIFIFTYPAMRKVSTCVLKNQPNGYLSSAFAGTEYLVSLTTYPNFKIVVWLWRSGDFVTEIDTGIVDIEQRIACSSTSPYQISQLGKISGKFSTYELNVCSRIVTITRTNGATPESNVVSSSWTNDGNLYRCDAAGNVSLVSADDGKKCTLIVHEESTSPPNGGIPLIAALGAGVILVNSRSQIVFYRKSRGDERVKSASCWRSVWTIGAESHPLAVARFPGQRDSLVFCGERGEIFRASNEDDTPRLRVISRRGAEYEFLAVLNPVCDHVAVIDGQDRFAVVQCLTGHTVGHACLRIHGKVQCVTSHPTLPIIATSTASGKCVIVSAIRPDEPAIIRTIHLQRESLARIRFSFDGDEVGVTDGIGGKLFLIGADGDERFSVRGLLEPAPRRIIDFLIYEGDEISKILILEKTTKSFNCGSNVFFYSFHRSEKHATEYECVFQLATNVLNSLNYGRIREEIIVVPYLTKKLQLFEIQKDYQNLTLTEALNTGHQLRNIGISLNNNFLVTCGYDGLIIVRNRDKIESVASIFMAHHRSDGGAKFAVLSRNIIVSLGRNGDLIATSLSNLEPIPESTATEFPALNTKKPPTNCEETDLTWIESKIAANLRSEREEFTAERSSIQKSFSELRQRLKILLDANFQESPDAQRAISDFDLDQDFRNKMISENVKNCEKLTKNLEEEIFQRDKVAEYLREMCWDTMETVSCSLTSINGNVKVDNFPIPRISKEEQNRRKWELFTLEFNESRENDETKFDEKLAENLTIMGSTTHIWIPEVAISPAQQIRKSAGYTEGIRASIVNRENERKLKSRFNELFEEMRGVKERELDLAASRIEEINHCSAELKSTFGIDQPTDDAPVFQPLWHYTEKPETIVTVTDSEIISGYAATYLERDISLVLLRKQEEENSKLNDEFREEALMLMMDGLLQVRWEDEIKKDPPEPPCLTRKDDVDFSEDEKAAVQAYNERCRYLQKEREKYKKLLTEKTATVKEALRKGVETFDRKLTSFHLDRLKTESAILQERLMRLRESQRHLSKREGMESMKKAQDDLAQATRDYRSLVEVTNSLEAVVSDTRNRYENLMKRDKLLETKLRGEFPDLKQPMVEHLLRHYRKRPRNAQLTCTSITYLTEIGRCVIGGEKSEILPRYCMEFLRGLDALDVMPNNLPGQIDANHWSLLCKLRRAKVELEIKITSCAVDLAEAEQTFASYQKSCTSAEHGISHLREATREREARLCEAAEDMKVQLVLKMGQIECHLYGDPNELSNAVLVPFSLVHGANAAIVEAGRKKLAAMRKTVDYRRTIMWREWRHNCMRMTLEDLREELKELQGVKVTKEIQHYLQSQCRDRGAEINAKTYDERTIVSTIERSRRILEDKKVQLIEARRKVIAWSKQNKNLAESTERMKLTSFKASMLANDEARARDFAHRGIKLGAIMKRTRLRRKVQENYGRLMALHTRLELLRLKTYPTLRLKSRFAKQRHDI